MEWAFNFVAGSVTYIQNYELTYIYFPLYSEALNMILSSESPDSEDLNDQG